MVPVPYCISSKQKKNISSINGKTAKPAQITIFSIGLFMQGEKNYP
jgi:hypothetical protein